MRSDLTYKIIFGNRFMVEELMHWLVADLHGVGELVDALDLSGMKRAPEQSVTSGARGQHGYANDIVWQVPIRHRPEDDAGEGWRSLVVMLEFQSAVDYGMALRIRNYVDNFHMERWRGERFRSRAANPAANIGNAPCEVVERQAPLRIERYELVPDSGGAGQWRGGLAVMRQFRYLGERATLQLRSDRRHHRPFGVYGGLPGAASTNLLLDDGREEQWPTKFVRPLLRDQAIRHITAGAGGYGDPRQRDTARVLDDVRNGKVSVQAAERDYGVRVSGPPWCVEEPATRALRAARASSPDTAPGPRR